MYSKILVPVDGSPTSDLGLDEALKLASLTGAHLKLIHICDLLSFAVSLDASLGATPDLMSLVREEARGILDRALQHVEEAGQTAETLLSDTLSGRVCDQVVDEAKRWEADLIVIGTHGRRGVKRFVLGSDAEQIARAAPVPVLLVRGRPEPEREAPAR